MTETELKIFLNDKVSDIADALLFYYDCCGMKDHACKVGDPNPCCTNRTKYGSGCPFLKDGICHFKNADCKLWFCDTAIESTDPKCVEALKLLGQFAKLFDIARRPLTGEPYTGADRPR